MRPRRKQLPECPGIGSRHVERRQVHLYKQGIRWGWHAHKMISKGSLKLPSSTTGLSRTLSHSKLLDGGRPASKLAGQAGDETVSQLGLGCSAFRLSHSCVLVLGGLLRTHTVRIWSANMLHPGERRQPPAGVALLVLPLQRQLCS